MLIRYSWDLLCLQNTCLYLSFARWLAFVFEDLLQWKQIAIGKREKGQGVGTFLYAFIEQISQLVSFWRLDLFALK